MKIYTRFLFGMIAAVLCCREISALPTQGAYLTNGAVYNCPQGCFCLNGGHTNLFGITDEERHQVYVEKCKLHAKRPSSNNFNYKYGNISVASSRASGKQADYYIDEFSEFYTGDMGFYGIINGDLIYGYSENSYDMFQCPYNYPDSDQGASSLSQCFKYDTKGNKVYYTSITSNINSGNSDIDIGTVNALVKDLQSALSKAQALQEALNKSNQGNKTTPVVSSKTDIDAMKAMISAGITDTKVVSDKQIKKVRK